MRIKVVDTHAIRKVVPYTGVIVKTEPAPAPDDDVPFLLPRKDGKTWIKIIYPSKYVTNNEFVIYLSSVKGSPVYVDWGDDTEINQTTSTSRDNVKHSYENPGIYYISIWSDGEYHLGYINNPCITPISYVLELEIGKNVVLLQSAFTNATRLLAIYNNAENIWRPHDIGQSLFQGRLSPVVKLLGLKLDGTGSQCGAYMFRNSSVMSITVGEYVTGLPTGLCYGDTSLREFNATENLKMISASVFSGCTGNMRNKGARRISRQLQSSNKLV